MSEAAVPPRVAGGVPDGIATGGHWRVRPRALRAAMVGTLLAGIWLPPPTDAQAVTPHWTFQYGRATTAVVESYAAGYPAVPISALEHVGVEVTAVPDGARMRLEGVEVVLTAGSPYYVANGSIRQLVHAVHAQDGRLLLPVQFLVDHLPALLGEAVAVELSERLVRRAEPAAAPASLPAPTPAAARATPAPAAAPVETRATARPRDARRLVVIDAGHGGVDPGAQGSRGTREKDINLAVARRLAALLREDPSFEVRMTRDRDTLIALTDRTRMANQWRRDGQEALFMSIHTNAHERRTVRGFETFFLSEARTEDARRVAQMENAAQRYENPGKQLDPLSFILHDLRQNKYLRDSSNWAEMIQTRLAAVHPGPNRGVKQAGFVVLNGAFMPAVLVELGFITHPAEERLLASPTQHAQFARQLARAITDFFDGSSTAAEGN